MNEKTAQFSLRGLFQPRDLTEGTPWKTILAFALPIIISYLLQQVYTISDAAIVGQTLTAGEVAGVNDTTSIIFIFLQFAFGVSAGFCVVTAAEMGAHHEAGVRRSLAAQILLSAALTVLLTGLALLLLKPMLAWINVTPESPEVYRAAHTYCAIIFAGIGAQLFYNFICSFLRSMGDSVTPLLFLLLSTILNIGLDLLFIVSFHWGVAGAAIATVLSQTVSAVWILRFLTGRRTILRLKARNMPLQGKIILPCLALGISSFVMVSTESILSVSFTSSLSRYGGDVAVGAMTVLTSVNQLITMPLQGICQGGQPLISYNYGAKKLERVKEAFFRQFLVCVGYTTVFWLLVMAFPKVFAGIFTSDGALVDYTAWAIRIFLAGTFSVGFQVSCQLAFMALGQAKISLIMACLRKLILLIPLIFILPNFFADKAFAVFLAEPVSDILAAAVTTITFFTFFRRLLKAGKQ